MLTEHLATYATAFIDKAGYPGIFLTMVLESMVFPLPSEAVMPFAGCKVYDGRFTFEFVVMASTFGSIVGSLLSYFIGKYGGKPFVDRFGRILLLNREDLAATERFFTKYGQATIFFSRFIPVVRHLISLPAGTGKMNLVKFSMYTVAGACLWNGFLAFCGFLLRKNWENVMHYSRYIDIAVVALLALGLYYFITKHLQRRKKAAGTGQQAEK